MIEPLESRIAPAATFTFADVDGDFVTVKTSRGTDAQLNAIINTAPTGLGLELQEIDFSEDATNFAGTTLTVTATRTSAGGDGLVNVGYIDATDADDGAALDLGAITIKGDLGRIDAGDATLTTFAVKSLNVGSMQQFGNSTQGGGASYRSLFAGGLGGLVVKGNLAGASLEATGGDDGRFDTVKIGGSIIGGANLDTGSIVSSGPIGKVTIVGNIEGGGGGGSGAINAGGTLAGVTVGGSVFGGGGNASGNIRSTGTMGPIKIAGDLVGGDGSTAGAIFAVANIASISIGGSLIGGTEATSGEIYTTAGIGSVKIGGDLRGGSAQASGYINSVALGQLTIAGSIVGGAGDQSGLVSIDGLLGAVKIGRNIEGGDAGAGQNLSSTGAPRAERIASISLGGSLIAGTASGGGELSNSGVIRAGADIGAISIKGSIIGNSSNCALIVALGQAVQGATDVAIKSLTVGGRVEDALILAGYDGATSMENGDAQIGAVKIGGDWIASSLVAGAQDDIDDELGDPLAADFGDADDDYFGGDNGSIFSRIASITIGGAALGTIAGGDHFGFVAQQIGSLRIAGTTFPLAPGAGSADDLAGYAIGATGDLRVRELAL